MAIYKEMAFNMLNILIVNYNTQELTECAIKSTNKYTPNCHIYVFDNSNKTPFVNKFDNVTVLDNTKKQIVDLDEFLSHYPDRTKSSGYLGGTLPSARHCYSIEKAMDLIGANFILMDSDVIVKRDLNELVDNSCIFVGDISTYPFGMVKRVVPYVCFINYDMCKKNGVHYFDENYMHGLYNKKLAQNADLYDTGAAFYLHASKYQYKTIDHTQYVEHYKAGSWDSKASRSVSKYKSAEDFMQKYKIHWETNKNKVVYTCISGPYDMLREPGYIDDDYDYICFTDQNFNSEFWNIRPLPKEVEGLSQVKKQRYVKLMAHKILPEYDFSVWVDANVDINSSIDKYIHENCDFENKSLFVGKHPIRDCIYSEEKVVIKIKKDKGEITAPQISRYKEEGFPEHFGLPQTCILMRKHNDSECVKLDELWWEELKGGSHRDQLSFSYVMWKLKTNCVQYLSPTIFNCVTFKWGKHIPIKSTNVSQVTKPIVPAKTVAQTEIKTETANKKNRVRRTVSRYNAMLN